MKRGRLRRLGVPITLALAVIGVVAWSRDYTAQARALPVLVAWTTLGLLVLEAVVQTGTPVGQWVARLFSGRAPMADEPDEAHAPPVLAQLRGIAWPVVLVALIIVFGILPAVPAYTFLSLKLAGGKSTVRAAGTALGVTAFVWALFEWSMSYPLYRGVLAGILAGT